MFLRIPQLPFGRSNRLTNSRYVRVPSVVAPFVVLLVLALFAGMTLLAVAGVFVVAMLTPLLPRSLRLDWDKLDLDPFLNPVCPACHSRLSAGPLVKRGHVVHGPDGQESAVSAQNASCPQCRRAFSRYLLDETWSSWHEVVD